MYAEVIMEKIYYLDNAATTRMIGEVKKESLVVLDQDFFNPSAVYDKAVLVKRKIEDARQAVKSALGVYGGNIIFTGSATEANNTVIFSQRKESGKTYLFGAGEHPSVLNCAKQLELRGYTVKYIPLEKSGRIDEAAFEKLISPEVAFISIQHVSNETGAINDIKKLVKKARRVNPSVLFHSDGVQAFMKIETNVSDLDVDYYTVSGHKIGACKGVGALYVRKGAKLTPLLYGGGQENNLRSSTENVFGIVSLGLAAKKLKPEISQNYLKVQKLREEFLTALQDEKVEYIIHGEGVAHIMNIMFLGSVRAETLVHALEKRGVYISTGSACTATKHFNATLEAMGIESNDILRSVRISFSPFEDIDVLAVAKIIAEELQRFKDR